MPFRKATSRSTQLNKKLFTCSHVFVQHDGVKLALQRPYNGPFKVIERSEKYFKINLYAIIDNVSIDRLKPADLLDSYTCEFTTNHSSNATTHQSKNRPHTSSKLTNRLKNPNASFKFTDSGQNSFKPNNL